MNGAYLDFLNWQYGDSSHDNFGCLMYRMIAKADVGNKERLRKGFPIHVSIHDRWMVACPNSREELITLLNQWQKEDAAYVGSGLLDESL